MLSISELNEELFKSIEKTRKRLQQVYHELPGNDEKSIYLKELIVKALNENN